MSNGVVMELECPDCGEWIGCDDHQVMTHCPECQTAYLIETDGEFVDGMWHCHTKLVKQQ